MNGIQSTGSPAATPSTGSVKEQMGVSVMKMQQDQAKVEGQMANQLINAAAEVQITGKGGRVNVQA